MNQLLEQSITIMITFDYDHSVKSVSIKTSKSACSNLITLTSSCVTEITFPYVSEVVAKNKVSLRLDISDRKTATDLA